MITLEQLDKEKIFNAILLNPEDKQAFRNFLVRAFSEGDLDFVEKLDSLIQSKTLDKAKANAIYNDYIKDNAEKGVDLKSE